MLWFCIATLSVCDLMKNIAPIFYPIRSSKIKNKVKQKKTIMSCLHAFFCTLNPLHVFSSSSDWFIGLSVFVVIGSQNAATYN